MRDQENYRYTFLYYISTARRKTIHFLARITYTYQGVPPDDTLFYRIIRITYTYQGVSPDDTLFYRIIRNKIKGFHLSQTQNQNHTPHHTLSPTRCLTHGRTLHRHHTHTQPLNLTHYHHPAHILVHHLIQPQTQRKTPPLTHLTQQKTQHSTQRTSLPLQQISTRIETQTSTPPRPPIQTRNRTQTQRLLRCLLQAQARAQSRGPRPAPARHPGRR
uniref:Uncharacterized protein n=1 Tax=Arundo donax TaxID=35708 RepID=A0A0A9FAM3_ARUDO